ncbi:MAG: outer membrane beta-barrel protein [Xanthobacteraceae bacterium]
MKRVLIAGIFALAAGGEAFAADLPIAPPPPRAPAAYIPAPIPLYNWTGFYLGGNVGGIFSGLSASDSIGSNFTNTTSQSFLGGGQVGANYQFWGGLVIGAEADFDWLPNTKNSITATNAGTTATTAINNRWLTLVDARVGYAWDRLLVYGKGGGAFAGASNSNGTVGTTVVNISGPGSNSGWTAGAGVEYAFAGTWSVRAEYDFVRLNAASYTVPASAPAPFSGDTISSNNRQLNIFSVGLNYKFGGW